MTKNRFFVICPLVLLVIGCHNNAHLRTQKILEPGEKAFSGNAVLNVGGVDINKNTTLRETGALGLRAELSYLKGSADAESGPYLGAGLYDGGAGVLVGYDYRKYLKLNKTTPQKLGTHLEINLSEAGQVFHFRPSWSSTTSRNRPLYIGLHGILATGRLQEPVEYSYIDSSEVYEDDWETWYGEDYYDENIPYSLTSLGAGVTAGVEFLSYSNYSFQLQVDVSLVQNTYSSNWTAPENTNWEEWEKHEMTDGFGHSDNPVLLVSGSMGFSFLKPNPSRKVPFEPLPAPSKQSPKSNPVIIYDPETGQIIKPKPNPKYDNVEKKK